MRSRALQRNLARRPSRLSHAHIRAAQLALTSANDELHWPPEKRSGYLKQPLPPPPPELAGAEIAVVVPIRYNIR